MNRARRFFERVAGAIFALVIASTSPGSQEDPPLVDTRPWRLLLEQQLSAEKGCALLEVILFDEFERDDETILEGKISCVDGRKFDFRRRHSHQKFELDLCEPAVC